MRLAYRCLLLAACLVAPCALYACSDDQSVDSGAAPQGQAAKVDVAYGSQSANVDLGTVTPSTYKGQTLVRLSDLWTASKITGDPSKLAFEFASEDGFTPSSKGCADLPGTLLAQGYIDPTTRNLVWDEALGLRGCYSIKNAAKITAVEPGDGGLPEATVVEASTHD